MKVHNGPKVFLVPTVNYHLWKPCNMKCGFCFATFPDLPNMQNVKYLKEPDALRLIDLIAETKIKKINFAGGEPTLCRWLPSLIRRASENGLQTSIVTNGSKITDDWLDEVAGCLNILALSIDSIDCDTQKKIGRTLRGQSMDADAYMRVCEQVKDQGIRLKINTVVNRYNCHEDFRKFISVVHPERWKIFQVLRVERQNDERIDEFSITEDEFNQYVERNASVERRGVRVVPENNELMTGSYLMISPLGQFFDNTEGRHSYSRSILEVGIDEALGDISISSERFYERGGEYE